MAAEAVSLKYVPSGDLKGNKYVQKHMRKYESFGPLRQRIVEHIEKNFPKSARILDVGCGSGMLESELIKRGYKNIEFCDVDNYLVHVPASHAKRLRVVNLNHDPLPYKTSEFDLVIAIFVLEHIENPYHFARETNRVLRRGGTLIVLIPSTWNIFQRAYFLLTGDSTEYILDNNHTIFFSKTMFQKPFKFNGFSLFKEDYSHGVVPFLRFSIPSSKFFGANVAGYFKNTKK